MEYFKKCRMLPHPENSSIKLLVDASCRIIVYEGELNEDNIPHGKGIQYRCWYNILHSKRLRINDYHPHYGIKCRMGTWTNGILNGFGYQWYKNGIMYKGNLKNDKPDGFGKFYNKKRSIDQSGIWKNGSMYNGYGTIFYKDGTRYKGDVIDGLRWGNGIMYDKNGKEELICTWSKNHIAEQTQDAPLPQ